MLQMPSMARRLPDTKVDFFGYRTERIKDTKRHQIFYNDFSRQTDKDGRIILTPSEMKNNHHWLAMVSTGNRLAFLGFSSVWYPNYYDRPYNQTKTFIMTDRPVYRPKQKVRFKLWVRHAKYDQADSSVYAGRSFSVMIHNPRNEQIFSRSIQADSHGGLAGEFDIPRDAPLGVYRISHGSGGIYGGNTFRVEEYKKPEFEVKMEAPEEPVMLGEKITADHQGRLLLWFTGDRGHRKIQGLSNRTRRPLVSHLLLGLVLWPRVLVVRL